MPRPSDRLPPYSAEAERAVLGSIIDDQDVLYRVVAKLEPTDFFIETHASMYRAILGLVRSHRPVDPVTVSRAMVASGWFDDDPQQRLLVDVVEGAPLPHEGLQYARIVRELAQRRAYIASANEVLNAAYGGVMPVGDLADLAERSALAVRSSRADEAGDDMGAALDAARDEIERLRSGAEPGLLTGLRALDEVLGRLEPGQVTIVGARPSIGKTAMLAGMARAVAEQVQTSGQTVLFCSLEMSSASLVKRLVSAEAQIDGRLLNSNPRLLRDRDLASFDGAANRLRSLPIHFVQSNRQTTAGIASQGRRLIHRGGLAAVFVDYLQIVRADSRHARAPKHEQIAGISNDLFGVARELGVPVVVGCQLNRESERSHGKDAKARPPRLADLGDSGAIERDANTVILLHRPEFYDPDDRAGEADLIVAKNRTGVTAKVRVGYRKRLTQFHDLDEVDPTIPF